jgi:hypothetical protein
VYVVARIASDGAAGSGVNITKVRELVAEIDREHRHLHPRVHAFLVNHAPYPDAVSAALKVLDDAGDLRRGLTYVHVTRAPNLAVFSKDVLNTMQMVMDRFISSGAGAGMCICIGRRGSGRPSTENGAGRGRVARETPKEIPDAASF